MDTVNFTAGNIGLFIHHFLLCFEMFILAIFHRQVFGYEEFISEPSSPSAMEELPKLKTISIETPAVVRSALDNLNPFTKREKNY